MTFLIDLSTSISLILHLELFLVEILFLYLFDGYVLFGTNLLILCSENTTKGPFTQDLSDLVVIRYIAVPRGLLQLFCPSLDLMTLLIEENPLELF
jgi:hypothetical protein